LGGRGPPKQEDENTKNPWKVGFSKGCNEQECTRGVVEQLDENMKDLWEVGFSTTQEQTKMCVFPETIKCLTPFFPLI
jgi:hypothetical protein